VQTARDCVARLARPWDEVHLDHDLGGEIYVNPDRDDCGMEVVRWLCRQRRRQCDRTLFFVHSYNEEAAEVMVSRLLQAGYRAVYRPFGIDVLQWELLDQNEGRPPARRRRLPEWLNRMARRLRPRRHRPDHGPSSGEPPEEDAGSESARENERG
jgi:hypothetical protein